MTLTDMQQKQAIAFRAEVDARLADDSRLADPQRDDRPDGSTLTSRYPVRDNEHVYLEVTVRPLIPQVRIGIVTDDRWKSEEIEEGIESSGDTMEEYLEVAFAEAGLDWEEPPVEHYRGDGKWFSFVTPLELTSLDDLAGEAVRAKVMQMIAGYLDSYGKL
jgi:hypothetical protein